jgi:hypothetical protein
MWTVQVTTVYLARSDVHIRAQVVTAIDCLDIVIVLLVCLDLCATRSVQLVPGARTASKDVSAMQLKHPVVM